MGNITETYFSLLDAEHEEQKYQEFIENNPEFLPRQFMQNHGIHYQLFIRKLKLSNEYTSDFFFMSKSTDDWNYVLIEIEKPQSKFFKKGTNDIHGDFRKAIDQIKSWQSWFNNATNKLHFENQMAFLKKPIHNTPVNIKYILVLGRRSEIEGNDSRLAKIKAYEEANFKIMTFDSLAEDIARKHKLYLAVNKASYVEIHNDTIIDESIFEWVSVSDIRIKKELKAAAISHYESKIVNKSGLMAKMMGNQAQTLKEKVSQIFEFKV